MGPRGVLGKNSLEDKRESRDFPGHPVVKTLPSSAGNAGSIPGQGTKIPQTSGQKTKNMKQKQYCNKFNKDFLNALYVFKKSLGKRKKSPNTEGIRPSGHQVLMPSSLRASGQGQKGELGTQSSLGCDLQMISTRLS